ncbi:MAG: ABC transporter permease, partial [Clostridiales bacterium]|nr:ABC transporter permease [Clostridiales bacterium]
RVINNNVVEAAVYQTGTDITLTPSWPQIKSVATATGNVNPYEASNYDGMPGFLDDNDDTTSTSNRPEIEIFNTVTGIEGATRVLNEANVNIGLAWDSIYRKSMDAVRMMGVDSTNFHEVANPLVDKYNSTSLKKYDSALSATENGVIISRGFAEQLASSGSSTYYSNYGGFPIESNDTSNSLSSGSPFTQSSTNSSSQSTDKLASILRSYSFNLVISTGFTTSITIPVVVVGVVDYWPTYYPEYVKNDYSDDIVVGNIDYFMKFLPADERVDLWLKKDPKVKIDDVYKSMEEKNIMDKVQNVQYEGKLLLDMKNDSLLLALNGAFSMGFVSTMLVSMIGFLVYWMMSIRKRKLQFGILRAIGVTRLKTSIMILWEHLMTSGVAVAVGMLVGNLAVKQFVPLLKMAYNQSVLPSSYVTSIKDTLNIYITVGLMLIAGIVIIAVYIDKLKINEAVKLGED